MSVVSLPDAPPQPWLHRRDPAPALRPGALTEHAGPDGRRLWVHEPRTEPGAGPLPVVIVLDGEVWAQVHDLTATLDNLRADGELRPALTVLVDSGDPERRWAELDGSGRGADGIADRLLPWVRERWPVARDPSEVVVAGQSLGGLEALQAVLHRPDAVGAALSQSASLWRRDLAGLLDGRDLTGLRAYIEVGTQEWVLHEPNERFAALLAAAGAAVRFVPYNGGHDYACWRGGIAEGLRHLLGPG